MKNILNTSSGIATLLSNVDDGTNSIYINGDLIPATDWTGTGNYTFIDSGVTFTIEKISDNSGNIMLQLVSGTTYTLLKCLDSDSFGSGVYFGTCTTAAATAAKEVTLTNTNAIELKAGIIVGVKFNNSNTASNVTLNVNGSGAKSIYYNNAVYTGNSNSICGYANRTYYYMYDGTYWVFLSQGVVDNNTYTSAYCSTAAGTAAKAASCSGYNLLANSYIHIIMTTANTSAGALTLNINGKGAKPIYINGAASSSSNYSLPAGSYLVYYNGTNYYFRTDGKVTSAGIVDIGGNTGKYAKGDGTWGTPTNTTYTFATGDSNGQIKVTPSGGTAQNVSVKGLGTAAYTASTAYAVSKELTNENLNNITTPGFYNAGGSNTCTNKPSGINSFGLQVVHTASGNYYYQILNPGGTSDFYRRTCTEGTWGSWTQDKYTDTTYESKAAASGGTAVSLCTTGEKYTWNNKANKGGDTITGSWTFKRSAVDASKSNNNISADTYPSPFKLTDTADRILATISGNVKTDGTIGSSWQIQNFNTSGTSVGTNTITMTMNKSGVVTYSVGNADKFRSAINTVSKGGDTFTGNVTIDRADGTTSTVGSSYLIVGNSKDDNVAGNSRGCLRLHGAGTKYTNIQPGNPTSDITLTLPASSGTLCTTAYAQDYVAAVTVPKTGGTITGNLSVNEWFTVYKKITVNRNDGGSDSILVDAQNGTTSAAGLSQIVIGNNKNATTAGNSYGSIALFSRGTAHMSLQAQTVSSARNLYLPASGTALATSASSSARVKENIREMTEEEALKILDVSVVKFDYKEEFEDGKLDQSGVIAEEILEIIPEVVTLHPNYDETKAIDPANNPSPTVDYGKFAPYLIKMVQMQQERIEKLERIIAELRE